MLVHKEKRALIFKLREPNKITTVIPTAKLVRHNGDVLVAVPHRPDEVRVLRQLGFSAPDPMRLYYNWPGRYTPMKEQIESSSFATMNSRCFVLNSMGTGKTITVLWSYDYLRSVKLVKRVLIACPLSVMERTWADHVFQSFPHLDVKVLYGTVDRRRKLLRDKADIYIINVDGLPAIRDDLASRPDIDLIIVDESALYRNGTTRRWKTLNVICNRQVPRRVLGAYWRTDAQLADRRVGAGTRHQSGQPGPAEVLQQIPRHDHAADFAVQVVAASRGRRCRAGCIAARDSLHAR